VVIVVGGLGLSQTGTQYAIKTLPEEITLAFAANGNSLQRWMQEARRQGHEILLQVPFEPYDYPANDPGAGTLTVEAGADANLADLHTAMSRITNYTGITNFMGGRFLADPDALEPVMRDLAERGIMFLDDGTSAQSLTDRLPKHLEYPLPRPIWYSTPPRSAATFFPDSMIWSGSQAQRDRHRCGLGLRGQC
jgi:polysaccharide deacetylase 2 family uncharacterized protein YibQ